MRTLRLLPNSNKRFSYISVLLVFSIITAFAFYRIALANQKILYAKDQVDVLNNRETQSNEPYDGIPKIIHQIWRDDVIPDVFNENIKGLVAHNKYPEWQYYFWTDETGEKFLNDTYPDLLRRFSTARTVLKADILRLAVIYHYGGVYFDLDTVSVRPLNPFVETHSCSFTTDPPEHLVHYLFEQKIRGEIITNCVMLCKPGHWFIWHVMEMLVEQSAKCIDAVKCVGPGIITREYFKLQFTKRSKDLPSLEDFQLFTDKLATHDIEPSLTKKCNFVVLQSGEDWRTPICDEFIRRGGATRNISDRAYTYHTWAHIHQKRKQLGSMRVKELVPHVFLYPGLL